MAIKFKQAPGAGQYWYSLAVMILIPAAIVMNTVWFAKGIQRDFDTELRRKANLANEVFGVAVVDILSGTNAASNQLKLQQLVDQTVAKTDEIQDLEIITPEGTGYKVLAASNHDLINHASRDVQLAAAWSEQTPIAALVQPGEGLEKAWRVITPIADKSKQVAVVRMDVSVKAASDLLAATLKTSLIVLVVTVIVVLLLLVNHMRLVEYAVLFRKQKELDQMKNDFISVATHELKSPMTVIKGYLSEVIEGSIGTVDEKAKGALKIAFEQTERLTSLVGDLLDVTRLEQGRMKYELSVVNPVSVITPIVEHYQHRAAAKNLKLVYEPPAEMAMLVADPSRFNEIISNLVDNALKYSIKGTVVVTHQVEGDLVKTMVRDTGIGMSPAARERLFERFYRIKTEQTAKISGTGLGLWIIKQYIEAMGGKIVVESTEGTGSQFTVQLPRSRS